MDSFTTDAPSLTNSLQSVLDEQVLQILPTRIVAVRHAKKMRRPAFFGAGGAGAGGGGGPSSSALHSMDGDALDSPSQQRHLLHGNNSAAASFAASMRAVSSDEAFAINDAAQREMRSLSLDRTEFVTILTELLVERVLVAAAADRERGLKYGVGSSSSSSSSSPSGDGQQLSFQERQQEQATYFSDEDAEAWLRRVWVFDKYKHVMHLPTSSFATASSSSSPSPSELSSQNRNTRTAEVAAAISSHNQGESGADAAQPITTTTTTTTKAREPFMLYWRVCPYLSHQTTRTVWGLPRHQLHPDDLAVQEKVAELKQRVKRIEEQAALLVQQRTLLQKQQHQQQQMAEKSAAVAAAVAAASAEESASAAASAASSPRGSPVRSRGQHQSSPHRPSSPTTQQQQQQQKVSFFDRDDDDQDDDMNANKSKGEEQHQHESNTAELKAAIAELSKRLPPTEPRQLETWLAIHDRSAKPFPASFLESLPHIQQLKRRIEPLVDYVFAQADVDKVEKLSFREISELILEKQGRLTSTPFRPNLHLGEELVLDGCSKIGSVSSTSSSVPTAASSSSPQPQQRQHHRVNIDSILNEKLLPRARGAHVCAIEGSPHLVLVSDGEGSALLDARTLHTASASGVNHIIRMDEPNLHQPRVLEMSMEQICYPTMSKRARATQLETDRIVARQQHELAIRRAANTAEQLTLSNDGASSMGRGGGVSMATMRFATGNDDKKMQRSLRAMTAAERATSVLNKRNDGNLSQRVFRAANYLVTLDGSMSLYIHHFAENQIASPFAKEATARVRLPMVPLATCTGGGLIFVGDSSGHVSILDASALLVGEPFERALSAQWRGNHTFVSNLVHSARYNGSLQAAIDGNPAIKAALTHQNMRPEQYQLGGASITGIEPLFSLGHNKFVAVNLTGLIWVVDIGTMSMSWCTQAHNGSVLRLMRISGTDTFLTTGFDKHGIKVWSGLGGLAVNSLRLLDAKDPHTTRISVIEPVLTHLAAPNLAGESIVATRIVSADLLGLVKVWQLETGLCTHSLHVCDAREAGRIRDSTAGSGSKLTFGGNSNSISKDKAYTALTAHSAAQFADSAPIQQGAFVSALNRFCFLGYRSRGVVRLEMAESNIRAHFGAALSVALPLSRRLVTAAGNGLRVWGLRDAAGEACLSPLARSTAACLASTGVPGSPLLLDLVSPLALGFVSCMCVDLEEDRVFCATSSGCVAVFRVETGRLLKVFHPNGKAAVAADAQVVSAHEKAGACIALEDPAAFRPPKDDGEILGVCYSPGNRELVVMMAAKNALLIYSDVGKQRTPIRSVILRTEDVSSSASSSSCPSPVHVVVPTPPALPRLSSNKSFAHFQLASRAASAFKAEAAAMSKFQEQQQHQFTRGLAGLWSSFALTGSPSIVTLLPDRSSATTMLAVYSADGETGIEQQRLACCVDVLVEDDDGGRGSGKKMTAAAAASSSSSSILDSKQKKGEEDEEEVSKKDDEDDSKQQEQTESLSKEYQNDDDADDAKNSSSEQQQSSHDEQKKKTKEEEQNKKKKKSAMRALLATSQYANTGLFAIEKKKEQQYKKKDFIRSAVCLAFLGDFSFLAVGTALDNTILIFPTRSGVVGRTTDGLESRVAEYCPGSPNAACVIHHIEEPHTLAWCSSRMLLYVANNNSLRVVVYSLARWLHSSEAACVGELVARAVDAPDSPRGVLPSIFHDVPRYAVVKARQQFEAEEEQQKKGNDDDSGTTTTTTTRKLSSFFLTDSVKERNNNSNIIKQKNPSGFDDEDDSESRRFALSSILFTERLLKNKSAEPPLLLDKKNSSDSSICSGNKRKTVVFPLYARWAEVQPCRVAMMPDRYHFGEGAEIPKEELRGEMETPTKRFGEMITALSVLDQDLGGSACVAVAYQNGKVLLFSELLSPIGELRADQAIRAGYRFLPSLPVQLREAFEEEQQQRQQKQQQGETAAATPSSSSSPSQLQIHTAPPAPLLCHFRSSVEFHIASLRSFVLSFLLPSGSAAALQRDGSLRAIHAMLRMDSPYDAVAIDVISATSLFSSMYRDSTLDGDDGVGISSSSNNNNNVAMTTDSFFRGFALWLSMSWRLGGNDEKRWGRFVTWRRLEATLRQTSEVRRVLRQVRNERQRLVDANKVHEAAAQMTRDHGHGHRADGHEEEQEEDPIKHLRHLLASNTDAGVPLEWLSDEELVKVGQQQMTQRLSKTAAAALLSPEEALHQYMRRANPSWAQAEVRAIGGTSAKVELLDHEVPEGVLMMRKRSKSVAFAPTPPQPSSSPVALQPVTTEQPQPSSPLATADSGTQPLKSQQQAVESVVVETTTSSAPPQVADAPAEAISEGGETSTTTTAAQLQQHRPRTSSVTSSSSLRGRASRSGSVVFAAVSMLSERSGSVFGPHVDESSSAAAGFDSALSASFGGGPALVSDADAATAASRATLGTALFDSSKARSRNAVRGLQITKQVKPVLSARGISAADKFGKKADRHGVAKRVSDALHSDGVARQHGQSVREVVEDAQLDEVPQMYRFRTSQIRD